MKNHLSLSSAVLPSFITSNFSAYSVKTNVLFHKIGNEIKYSGQLII